MQTTFRWWPESGLRAEKELGDQGKGYQVAGVQTRGLPWGGDKDKGKSPEF